jgi:hypothetical protein
MPTQPLDPNGDIDNPGAGEFSYGPGLDVPGYENALPRDGGRYRATVPATPEKISVSRNL